MKQSMSGANINFIIGHVVCKIIMEHSDGYHVDTHQYNAIVDDSVKELNRLGIIGNDLEMIVGVIVDDFLNDNSKNNAL